MPRSSKGSRPARGLIGLLVVLAIAYGTIGALAHWEHGQWTPKLGLDLEGGTQIVLQPVLPKGSSQTVSSTDLERAIAIIRQRVNGSGVSEAEVTSSGSRNIIVSLPGNPDQQTRDLVKKSAQLRFRAVLEEAAVTPVVPTPTPTASGSGAPSPSPSGSAPSGSTAPAPTSTTHGMALPKALLAPQAPQAPQAKAATPTPSPSAPAATPPAATPAPQPAATGASDLKQITPEIAAEFQALDCTKKSNLTGGGGDDPKKVLVACSQDGTAKYILGPAEVLGTDISNASAGIAQNSQGFSTGAWEVLLSFTSDGGRKFANVTTRLASLTGAQNQFGIVLDGLVISAPTTSGPIVGGQASITGNFTQDSATTLANQLKFGALPLSFNTQTEEQISPTLGSEQLDRGLLAGLIGLLLVVLYSLAQYRALGLVTVFSLAIAGAITYAAVVLLGQAQGFRLSLAGVAGLIVAIGITADSFIVYFERVRDEVRDGRSLVAAVDTGWQRARRTILTADSVSLLAAVVLYLLAVGGVQGFAYTLGLTTIIDVVVVFLFTHPVVTMLARTRFFGGGHKLSGFDAAHLGRQVTYRGRGRVVPRTGTIVSRRAAAAAAAETPEEPSPEEAAARPSSRER